MPPATRWGWMPGSDPMATPREPAPPPSEPAAPPRVLARFFDGQSSRPRVVELTLVNRRLLLRGPSVSLEVMASQVQWPERTERGGRVAHLPDGSSVHALDTAEWDAWLRASGHRESWVERAQRSWRMVLVTLAVLGVVGVAAQQWGVPWAARGLVALAPRSVDASLENAMRDALEHDWMQPSRLPPEVQASVQQAWAAALATYAKQAPEPLPPTRLLLRHSRIGPNALALPGGTLLLTDELVTLVQHDPHVLVGVLGHELGHVQHRHGLRMAVQVSLLGAATSAIWGDFSSVLSTVPLLLGQAHYSRQAEREADAYALGVLRAAQINPSVMVTLFERLEQHERHRSTGQADLFSLGFASHPAHAERITFFRNAPR